jgi:ribonucleoside-diphosphate reductase alpha chain
MRLEQWLGENNKLGMDIWTKKYQQNNETFDEWLDRVSGGDKDLKELIVDKKFLFGGRILSNRGLAKQGKKVTYSNCYVIAPPEDNIESIFDTAKKLARTFSYGGGCGIDISKLAPRGAVVNNTAKETTGSVSFMHLYNMVTDLIGQNGRRGALMLSLDCNHPDLEEFISIKNDLNSITKANISVRVDDEFMKAVVYDLEHLMIFHREETGEEICKKVRARDVFRKLCENNWNYAEPGILFWDQIRDYNLLQYDPEFEYAGVNPCAEEPLPAGGSCLLGSINLSAFVIEGTLANDFDHAEFRHAVRVAVRALNDVLDEGLELHPLQEQRDSVRDWRQIGLGIFGLADMLIKMGIEYGSKEAIKLCDNIGRIMAREAIKESAQLAKQKGAYPKFNKEAVMSSTFYREHNNDVLDKLVSEFGLRNSQLLTIAPTGSISTMLGVSGGIEPIFDTHYTMKTESLHGKDEYYTVYTPIVERYMKYNDIKDVKDLPDFFITAKQLDGFKRVDMQSVWQDHIDASISSTVNLPESATVVDVEALYIYAWENGLKGMTIFRENCARSAVLTSGDKKEEEPVVEEHRVKLDSLIPVSREELGGRLSGSTYVKDIACGKLYITINRDENDNLVEVFIDPGKSGGCSANAECIGRYASACMRAGMSIDAIVDITKGVKCSACMQSKGAKKKIDGLSCGDVIAKTIQEEYRRCKGCANVKQNDILNQMNKKKQLDEPVKKGQCPECGQPMANSGGCNICLNCGYSKCD